MLPSLRRLLPAALLLASGALAESSLPAADVSAREIVTRVPAQQAATGDQLRALPRAVESLETEVGQLRRRRRSARSTRPSCSARTITRSGPRMPGCAS